MNSKLLLGFLGGLLAATAVFYVQSHRTAKVEAEPVAAVAPVAAPAPAPEATTIQATKPPSKKKTVAAVEKPVAPVPAPPAPAPVEQTKVEEAPPAPEPRPVATPVPAPAPVETRPEPPQPRSVTIASGTLLTVRLGESISTERSKQGDTFFATLDQPLVVDGLVIAERGARATGRLVDAVEAGRVRGLAHLSLELTSLMTSDGQKLELRTGRFEKEGPASKTEDTEKVGIGAAIGAAIGAIAGGGKGAAIGAATGGAAGGGVVAATRGKPAVLPAETKISFRLDQPVTVTEKR
ncbi:MAG: hypothetical protein JWO19_1903 [Bryobacterales bacterium]|nr:hypothetical protein [Bryobacterales bacterium]